MSLPVVASEPGILGPIRVPAKGERKRGSNCPCMILTIRKYTFLLMLGLLLAFDFSASAAPILFNTGVDDDGNSVPFAANTPDLHWTITSSPYGPLDAILANPGAFPIATGQWIPNTPTASWIGPANVPTGGPAGGATGGPNGSNMLGTYIYQTVFDLSRFVLNTVALSGSYAVDNRLTDIQVNGVSIGPVGAGGFNALTNFNIPAVGSLFVSGNNTLTFITENGSLPGDEFGPTGLFAQFSLTGIQVPELDSASATAPVALVLSSMIVFLDRRRKHGDLSA